jgi:uncharacterized protein YndB with AHSA1/START domain
MNELIARSSISITAPAARIWDVLTRPEFTKEYMFGCETVCDWKVGSPLLWKGMLDGKEIVYVKGTVRRIDPGQMLEYTTFDPNGGLDDVPANYVTVVYRLTKRPEDVLLEVTQGDFATVANSEQRYRETVAGWPSVLEQVKAIAERTT